MNPSENEIFAHEWLAAWNSRDLDTIMGPYHEDVEFHSPFMAMLGVEPSGVLHGKSALRGYFAAGLARLPDLRFDLLSVLTGVDSLAIVYRNQGGSTVAELMRLEAGRVTWASAHYSSDAWGSIT